MRENGVYGSRLGEALHLREAPTVVTRSLRKTEMAVTDCRSDAALHELSQPLKREDAYLVGLQMRDYPDCENWEDDRVTRTSVRAGQSIFYDLKRDFRFRIDKPFHALFFYIPRSAFNTIAEDSHAQRIGEIDYEVGTGVDDEVLRSVGASMMGALDRPGEASLIFVDHITLAVAAHVAQTYGGMRRLSRPIKGGLAGWQVKRARDMLDANLDGGITLEHVAAECGLSVSHFSRAFRESIGLAPHQWLLQRRVEVAKTLMQDRRISLSEIALSSGFADQSHFTRVFSKMTGVSPGAWRRDCEIGAVDA